MKGLFNSFAMSAKEFTKLRSVTITAMLIGLSMIIEMFSIDIGFVKLNFSFIANAAIGMLFGPVVGIVSGLACDVVGFIAHPSSAFLPIYTLVAGLQGMIYGVLLYHKAYEGDIAVSKTKKNIGFAVRIVAARLLDVIIINLLLNTALNLHYGFIPEAAYGTAIIARVAKNVIELGLDLPLLFVILPAVMMAYKRVFNIGTGRAKA